MKRAKMAAVVIEVSCPYCDAPQPEPDSGSFLWETITQLAQPKPWTCTSCGKQMLIPVPKTVRVG